MHRRGTMFATLVAALGVTACASPQDGDRQRSEIQAVETYLGDSQGAIAAAGSEAGRQAPWSAEGLNDLGLRYQTSGDAARAEQSYRRALEIQEQDLGPEHVDLSETLTNLAWVHYQARRYELAEPLFRRALSIRERALGPGDPLVAVSLSNLAVLCLTTGRPEEAEELSRRAAQIWGVRRLSRPGRSGAQVELEAL